MFNYYFMFYVLCATRKYKYQDVVSFISSDNACSLYPWNLQYIIGKGKIVKQTVFSNNV